MKYGVEELSAAAGLSVDTVRYYQGRGLLHAPEREGRRAVYDDSHLARLSQVRDLTDRGYSLRSIEELLSGEGEGASRDDRLRAALSEDRDGVYTRREFARALGVPQALLAAVEQTGLAAPQKTARGKVRYTEADLGAARSALKLLERGLPLTEMLSLAVTHHRGVGETVERAIDLFDDHVRKRGESEGGEGPEAVAEAYRDLMPVVTALVAHHFQRVLVNRALERLEGSGERASWRAALAETARGHLELSWR